LCVVGVGGCGVRVGACKFLGGRVGVLGCAEKRQGTNNFIGQ